MLGTSKECGNKYLLVHGLELGPWTSCPIWDADEQDAARILSLWITDYTHSTNTPVSVAGY